MEEDLFTYLAGTSLNTLIGSGDPDDRFRLYPMRKLAGVAFPCILYRVISAPRHAYTHDNAGAPGVGTVLVSKRIQFDLWAAKDTDGAYETLLPVEEALVAALSGYKGAMGGTDVQSCFIDNAADGFEPDTSSNRRTVDAVFEYEEG